MPSVKLHFPGISPLAWEHPADRAALNALRRVPGLDIAIRTVFGQTTERSLRLMYLASAVKVTPHQYPRIYAVAQTVNAIFGVAPENAPEVYVAQSPFLNAGAVGWHKPFIVLNSSIVEALKDDDELAGLYGHELGHILSGHVLYKTLLAILVQISTLTLAIPLTGLALGGLILALREWDRKSELSADRAGLLASQDLAASQRILMKLAGGGNLEQVSLDQFRKQAHEYENADAALDQAFKLLNLLNQTHPFAVLRVVELEKWASGENYARIMNGNYPTGRPEDNDLGTDFQQASDAYSEDFSKAREGVSTAFDELSKLATSAADEAGKFFGDFFKKGK
jgi:Zn-dependent protease with chaperone function